MNYYARYPDKIYEVHFESEERADFAYILDICFNQLDKRRSPAQKERAGAKETENRLLFRPLSQVYSLPLDNYLCSKTDRSLYERSPQSHNLSNISNCIHISSNHYADQLIR